MSSFTKRLVPNKLSGRIRSMSGHDRDDSNNSGTSNPGARRRSNSRSPHDGQPPTGVDADSDGGDGSSRGSTGYISRGSSHGGVGGASGAIPPSPPHHVSFSASGFGHGHGHGHGHGGAAGNAIGQCSSSSGDLDEAVRGGVPHYTSPGSISAAAALASAHHSTPNIQGVIGGGATTVAGAAGAAPSMGTSGGGAGVGGSGGSSSTVRPKKAWEWHYKSFLSKRAGSIGHGHSGLGHRLHHHHQQQQQQQQNLPQSGSVEPLQLKASRSLSSAEMSSPSSMSLDVRRRGGSPSSPNPRAAGAYRISSPHGIPGKMKGGGATAPSQQLEQQQRQGGIPASFRRNTAGTGSNRIRSSTADGYPSSAPTHRSVLSAETVPVDAIPPPALSSSLTASPPKMPASLRKGGGGIQYQLGPRGQHGVHAAASGDTAVRGGSFFKNMFKHGSSSGGIGGPSSDVDSHYLDRPGPTHSAHAGGGLAMRDKAKSYDSLDTTVRKGNEVAYGSKSGSVLRKVHPPQPQPQPQKPRSWDSNLYAPNSTGQAPAGDSSTSALRASFEGAALDVDGRRYSGDEKRPGANIGPQGNAEQELQRDMKKAFTEFHNSKHYGKDTTSAYLGDEPSVRANNYFAVRYGSGAVGTSTVPSTAMPLRPSTPSRVSSQSMLKTVTEGGLQSPPVPSGPCILKAIAGTETWLKDRRYLIGPAVVAMCPSTVLSSLPLGKFTTKSGLAAIESNATPSNEHPYERVITGKASISSVSQDGELSSSFEVVLVLRQNYLFEYAEGVGLNERPRAFAHLQNSKAYPHDGQEAELYLEYFGSPCAGGDMSKLLIRVESNSQRDEWVACLVEASQLKIEDLYDYDGSDEGLEFGRGRYATVRPANRKNSKTKHLNGDKSDDNVEDEPPLAEGSNDLSSSTHKKCDCALKIINKNEFWSRVIKDRERADTLVRETAVQASLSAQMGHLPTFLRLRNFFETIDNIVLELEILRGTDLFQHISSKGIVEEDEAAHIMRDILTCIDAMRRIGIAHRDVKPANILMCHAEHGDGIAVKVGDFGMATFVGHDYLLRGRCGTPGYVAPEILRSSTCFGYKNNVDVFSAGVTLYVLLCGYEPFYGECDAELIESNRAAKVEYPNEDWRKISIEGRDLVEKMLHSDPEKRISSSDALKHPWITRRAPHPSWQDGSLSSVAERGDAACTVQ